MSTTTSTTAYNDEFVCVPRAGTLYDVLELILDRGMVIDVFVRVSLVGIEILKIDARIVVASVDTYLRFAEACNRLDLENDTRSTTVPEMFGGLGGGMVKKAGKKGLKRAASSVGDKVKGAIGAGGDEDDDEQDEEQEENGSGGKQSARRRASGSRARSDSRRPARSSSRSGSGK